MIHIARELLYPKPKTTVLSGLLERVYGCPTFVHAIGPGTIEITTVLSDGKFHSWQYYQSPSEAA